jgi:hypothetical protein
MAMAALAGAGVMVAFGCLSWEPRKVFCLLGEDILRNSNGLMFRFRELLAEFGVTVHYFVKDSGKNGDRNFRDGKSGFLTGHIQSEIVDKTAFTIVTFAVITDRNRINFDYLSNT